MDPEPAHPSTSFELRTTVGEMFQDATDESNPGFTMRLPGLLMRQVHPPLAQLGVEPAHSLQLVPQ